MQEILASEWETTDKAVHRLEWSAKLENKINDHIYLKFPAREFTCQKNGAISLPVSTAASFRLLAPLASPRGAKGGSCPPNRPWTRS